MFAKYDVFLITIFNFEGYFLIIKKDSIKLFEFKIWIIFSFEIKKIFWFLISSNCSNKSNFSCWSKPVNSKFLIWNICILSKYLLFIDATNNDARKQFDSEARPVRDGTSSHLGRSIPRWTGRAHGQPQVVRGRHLVSRGVSRVLCGKDWDQILAHHRVGSQPNRNALGEPKEQGQPPANQTSSPWTIAKRPRHCHLFSRFWLARLNSFCQLD